MFNWSRSYSKFVNKADFSLVSLWQVWADVNNWNHWQPDVEWAKVVTEFKTGHKCLFQLKGHKAPIELELLEVVAPSYFVDFARFPGAKMFDRHEFIERANTVEIKTTVTITGILAPIWWVLVAQKVVNGVPKQIEDMLAWVLEQAKSGN